MESFERIKLEERLSKYELKEALRENKRPTDSYKTEFEYLLDESIDMDYAEELLKISPDKSNLMNSMLYDMTEKMKITNIRMSPIDVLILKNFFQKEYSLTFSSGVRTVLKSFMVNKKLYLNRYTLLRLHIFDEVKKIYNEEYKKNPDEWEEYKELFDDDDDN